MTLFYNVAFTAAAMMLVLQPLLYNVSPVFSQEFQKTNDASDCGYYMCEYEKGNIDTIIIEHAKTCQTLMFGEIHDTVLEGTPSPIEDSLYLITLLSQLKEIGYEYLALEVNKDALKEGHSYDIVRFYESYKKGENVQEEQYSHAKPGWIELIKKAMDIGYKIRFIDVFQKDELGSFQRDSAMFEEMKRAIFDENENAKVIVYIGANHIGECETNTGIYLCKGKRRPLGYFLDKYTKGKNFSVYMGHKCDTPVGCDLFISYFIWNKGKRGPDQGN